ncbi:SseB family protein [Flavobacterium sp.]|uniref:SseB family protein n=1 Tax=Flavobacterium sp. TaxID=239 RepID=UPI00261F122D|nr:SseB family protein [Flavobacterium sp.]
MNLFKKLFGSKAPEPAPEKTFTPNNTNLLHLIKKYHQDLSSENYKAVLNELYGDQAFLLVPKDGKTSSAVSDQWDTLKAGETIGFTTVFNVDGLLIFGVFTSEETLSKWITQPTSFLAMPSKTVLEIAEEQGFGRIVIDSDQDTMFVLERDVKNHTLETIQEDTEILIWMPKNPIADAHQKQFQEAFAKVSSIKEVYHFGITKHGEQVFLLIILLEPKTENAILAAQSSINDGMIGQSLEFPLEAMFVEEGNDMLETARQFGVFYKR